MLQGMEENEDSSDDDSIIEAELDEHAQLCVVLCQYLVPYVCRQPRRTSKRTGHHWVQEILASEG